ncbi:acyl-CoA dehydrogenase family protein [Candidatus Leptofilum sp.]|uniref:acyl-CoA dehydrogenase family protein n=1 Tax=Candidatus Leptofilum sp. TaxID=3241576 RepID=UPI003B5C2CC9
MLSQMEKEPKIVNGANGHSHIEDRPKTAQEWLNLIHDLGTVFAEREVVHDQEDSFVEQNYIELKRHGLLSAIIPVELGGGGLSHAEMADILRTLAQYSSSTALANSMHQHLVAANVWKYKNGKGAEAMLRNVVANNPVLVSTGARDWLESNGTAVKVDGGYLVSGYKAFASQSATGDIAVTSVPYHDPELGGQVLHFPVPLNSEGVSLVENWQAMGMRGTGSHMIKFDDVFVPETAVALKRPLGEYHPVWNVVLTVAMPLIMAVYVGIAQKAAKIALDHLKQKDTHKAYVPSSVGAMNNQLVAAEVLHQDMLRLANNFAFEPTDQLGHEILSRKTLVANAVINTVTQAMDIVGGPGYFRNFGLEKLFRDVQAAKYHPLMEKDQQIFSGNYLLSE